MAPASSHVTVKSTALDFRHLRGAPEEFSTFCFNFVDRLQVEGYVAVENHPWTGNKVGGLFEISQKFFNLPDEIKKHAGRRKGQEGNRGWAYVGEENVSAITGFAAGVLSEQNLEDLKETFDMGKVDDSELANLWPYQADLPGFRHLMETAFESGHHILLQLLRALAVGLGLSEDAFTKQHNCRHHEFRLLHYPAVPASALKSGESARISSHTDFGTMSFLFQDDVGGLEGESLREEGNYLPLRTERKDVMIVILGDMMMRQTNGILRALPHRVTLPSTASINAEGEEWAPERFAIAFFGKPDRDVWLEPMQAFVDESNPARYDGVAAGDYDRSKLLRLY